MKRKLPTLPIYFVYPEELKTAKKVQVFRDFLVAKARQWQVLRQLRELAMQMRMASMRPALFPNPAQLGQMRAAVTDSY